ncbi:hypothetical protein CSOJ01_14168 [Colletotrichum sojae]|uniref:Uncharacterized protein n=1 Tax=Colletotrichum sojae TaxID=2175907 RepID=A0A8H6MJD4_9PEZI|nr:hypothetical protein CSOJ01_14168 [Colletotrichum sojae]
MAEVVPLLNVCWDWDGRFQCLRSPASGIILLPAAVATLCSLCTWKNDQSQRPLRRYSMMIADNGRKVDCKMLDTTRKRGSGTTTAENVYTAQGPERAWGSSATTNNEQTH